MVRKTAIALAAVAVVTAGSILSASAMHGGGGGRGGGMGHGGMGFGGMGHAGFGRAGAARGSICVRGPIPFQAPVRRQPVRVYRCRLAVRIRILRRLLRARLDAVGLELDQRLLLKAELERNASNWFAWSRPTTGDGECRRTRCRQPGGVARGLSTLATLHAVAARNGLLRPDRSPRASRLPARQVLVIQSS
jgi:hypothetical protein